MGVELRYEAWTLPWKTFQREITDIPVIQGGGSGTIRLNDFGSGTIDVPANYDRLTDIISATKGTLIRAYDGAILIHEFMAERIDFTITEAGGVATISGSDIASAFDRAIIYPWDYPANPTAVPNWVWGGANILQNPGMEDALTSAYIYDVFMGPEKYEVYTTATSGNFTLTMEGDTTAAIDYRAAASTVASAINATTGITDVDVELKFPNADLDALPQGTSGNPWVVEFQDPHVLAAGVMTGDGSGLTGGTLTITTILDPALTFTLSIQAETTASIAWDATTTVVNDRLEALNAVNDVTVSGDGSPGSPYKVTFVDPEVLLGPMFGTGTGLTVIQTQTGSDEIIAGWTKSQRADQRTVPAFHGTYTIFRQSSGAEPAHSGTYSLVVAGTQYAGAQQVVNVQPHGVYQASIWVRTNAASQTFRLVIRSIYEEILAVVGGGPGPGGDARAEVTPAVDTWTQITIPNVLAESYQFGFGLDTLVFRIANVTPTPAGIWYFDDAEFNQGLPETPPGGVVLALMKDAAVDHGADTRGTLLTWVDYSTINETRDSSDTDWFESISFTAFRGATYGQTWDRLASLGYEWRLVPKATPSGGLTHDLEWYGRAELGTDHTAAATPAINVGQGITAGKVVQRIPDRTAVLVEGGAGLYVEDKNTTTETNFGRLEKYKGDTGINSSGSLTDAGEHMLNQEEGTRTAIQITVMATPDHPRPLVDYTVGDELNTQLPPVLAKVGKRISQISYQNTKPARYQITLVEPPTPEV